VTDGDLVPKIRKVFTIVLGPQVGFDPALSRAAEARWTSLKHVELLVGLEAEFGIRFDGGDATDMVDVASVIDKIRQRVS
jgi:acyl carrier protein